jgi:hypothetical protein
MVGRNTLAVVNTSRCSISVWDAETEVRTNELRIPESDQSPCTGISACGMNSFMVPFSLQIYCHTLIFAIINLNL